MVFVSYSHDDTEWKDRFLKVASPLTRYVGVKLWSDQQIRAGEKWRDEINKALDQAVVAVLLVSINSLASEFIATVELPYILLAANERKLKILWVRLTPCLFSQTPLRTIQAAAGMRKPLNAMNDFEWQAALCDVCDEIDAILRSQETPIINPALKNRLVQREEPKLEVLAKPAWRETEVLVQPSNGYWYTQARIPKGSKTTRCYFGDLNTKAGTTFKLVALTRGEGHLSGGSKHLSIPLHRTRSQEVTVKRA